MDTVYKTLRNRQVLLSPPRNIRYRGGERTRRTPKRSAQAAGTNNDLQPNSGEDDYPIEFRYGAANLQFLDQPPVGEPYNFQVGFEAQGLDNQYQELEGMKITMPRFWLVKIKQMISYVCMIQRTLWQYWTNG
ncbi:uncharacterized protein LOC108027542 [Drosophila biarmipes]|uniref:uncharacterized protein LOC108027542 n=1 Tax=Drosophila biarmipes TaxID=125945 RepID=UPI0007E64808|nr:uncharacterized protein LOC108027542 [Drosophila biarmipes]